ncbi:MAG TPA: hypothetical protein VFP32_02435 [Candidatus Saccharimonadales bacterium]|nr:hypothetical protein [Candidatus Saccharimonadales bacterium]
MSHAETVLSKINTADELVAAIDKSRAEKPSAEVIADLKKLAHQMTEDRPIQRDDYYEESSRRGHFKLVDGRDAEILDVVEPVEKTLITVIDHIDKEGGMILGVRKGYFLRDNNIYTSIDRFTQQDKNVDFQEFDSEFDEDETNYGLTMEEAEEAEEHSAKGSRLNSLMGVHETSNEEVVNLMRLLVTSEEIISQKV